MYKNVVSSGGSAYYLKWDWKESLHKRPTIYERILL